MAYTKTNWVNGETPINSTNLNKMEFGIAENNILADYGDTRINPDTTIAPLILTRHSNAPEGDGIYYYIKTVFFNSISTTSHRSQIAISYNKNQVWQRFYTGNWSSWVPVSPDKITTGTEVLTGEVIDNKPVYRKRIDLGSFTNNTNKTVLHNISNPTFIRISIMGTNGSGTYQDMSLRGPFESYTTGTAIVFNPGGNYSTWTGYADLWYTKN